MNLSEILPEPHADWELHTDGWYMFVTDRANFNHYLEFARQAVEDEQAEEKEKSTKTLYVFVHERLSCFVW